MFNKAIHFIQYNNLTLLILAVILVAGTGAFAATDAGQAVIGGKTVSTQGTDNTLLLDTDLDNFDMDFKIERVEQDDSYYYIAYTYLDLDKRSAAWEYQLKENVRKVSRKSKVDLGQYLAAELKEEYEARIKDLKAEQARAAESGAATRVEVTAYSGLIGATLDLAGRVFPGYEPVQVRTLPSPSVPPSMLAADRPASAGQADNLTDIYQEYVAANDPDGDDAFGMLDNCPNDYNPLQEDRDGDGIGDACDQYFTLTPEPDDPTATGTDVTASSSDVIATTTPDIATGTPETATDTEPDVIVVDIDEEERNYDELNF